MFSSGELKIVIVNKARWLRRYSRGPKLTNQQQRTAVNHYKRTKKNKKEKYLRSGSIYQDDRRNFSSSVWKPALFEIRKSIVNATNAAFASGKCRWRPVAERHGFIFPFRSEDTREAGFAYRTINRNNTYKLGVFQNKMCFLLNISRTNSVSGPREINRKYFPKMTYYLCYNLRVPVSNNVITYNDLNTIDWNIFQKTSVTNIAQ